MGIVSYPCIIRYNCYTVGMPNMKDFETREEYNEWFRKYRVKNKEKIALIRKRSNEKNGKPWESRNKLASHCHWIVKRAIKKGILIRKPCEVCNTLKNIRAHHNNYYKPLEVMWLCELHHREQHKKMKKIVGLK